MKRYFVLITDICWGIFSFDALDYPEIMYENLDMITVVEERDIMKYLLGNVGRNTMIKNNFDLGYSVGRVYAR